MIWTAIRTALGGIGAKVWIGLGAIAVTLLALLRAFNAGRDSQIAKQDKHDKEVKDDQLEAAANRPNTDAALDERLRNNRF